MNFFFSRNGAGDTRVTNFQPSSRPSPAFFSVPTGRYVGGHRERGRSTPAEFEDRPRIGPRGERRSGIAGCSNSMYRGQGETKIFLRKPRRKQRNGAPRAVGNLFDFHARSRTRTIEK